MAVRDVLLLGDPKLHEVCDAVDKSERHRACRIRYRDMDWREQELHLENDLSELLQHECDHLDGVLAVARAIDGQSFALRSSRR